MGFARVNQLLPLLAFNVQLHDSHSLAKRRGGGAACFDVARAQDDSELGALGEAADDFEADSFV
jgi:hypothetical protein